MCWIKIKRSNILMKEPHRHQAKKSKYPKTNKLTSPREIVHFFVFWCNKTLKLMDMACCATPSKKVKKVFIESKPS
ncbi:hypothetical protein COM96_10805 [Bacillus cereus]|uniref:Uncharacterized protein n=1 Tax=Bacillus cereus TaxID=1396 RepID=A0A2A7HYX9_BACCE|nr:hypothetical protein COM96_10805 [Bacillus cereus]